MDRETVNASVEKREGDANSDRFLLRAATVGDAESIESVHWAGLEAAYRTRVPRWPVEPRDRQQRIRRWRTWIGNPEIDVIVGTLSDEVVGFMSLRPAPDADLDPSVHCEMPTLYVHPTHWRRGYGRALCREALERASGRGFGFVVLWVLDVNHHARDFYRRIGFQPDAAEKTAEDSVEPLKARRYRVPIGRVQRNPA